MRPESESEEPYLSAVKFKQVMLRIIFHDETVNKKCGVFLGYGQIVAVAERLTGRLYIYCLDHKKNRQTEFPPACP